MKYLDWLKAAAYPATSFAAAMLACVVFHGCVLAPPGPTPPPPPPKPVVTVSGVTTDGKGHVTFGVAVDLQSPGPTPPVPPVPPGPLPPSPISTPAVLITFDSAKQTALPKEQQAILFDDDVWQYLSSHLPFGPDGKTKEVRIWDWKVDPVSDPSVACKAAFARPRAAPEWVVISNGKTGFEGPLPANKQDAFSLFKKYLEN